MSSTKGKAKKTTGAAAAAKLSAAERRFQRMMTDPVLHNFDDKKKTKWLETFEESGGSISAACEAAGISRATAYNHRKSHPDFARAWDEIQEKLIDELEQELFRRAAQGVERPVYQGGRKVGVVREFSDTLLIFAMKANRTKYADKIQVDGQMSHVHGVLLAPAPVDLDQWGKTVDQYRDTTQKRLAGGGGE